MQQILVLVLNVTINNVVLSMQYQFLFSCFRKVFQIMLQCNLQSRIGLFNIACFRCYAQQTSSKKTYYEILEVKPTANQDEIKASYLKLSKLFHPDTTTHKEKDTHNVFVILSEAYSVLSRPELRKRYNEKIGFGIRKSSQTIENPFRSSSYKDPYSQYDHARKHSEKWTDYYSTYGRKRARYKMEQNVESEFWKKHWEFSREHGGGGPRIATHEIKDIKKSYFRTETGKLVIVVVFACVFCFAKVYYSSYGIRDREKINQDYQAYLVNQLSGDSHPDDDKPKPFAPSTQPFARFD